MYNGNEQSQEYLGHLLNRTSRTIRRYFNKELARRGYPVTGEHFDVLVLLKAINGLHQQLLAEMLFKDKTTMTRIIKKLDALKLVRRVTNKKDARQKLVYLTPSGRKIVKDMTSLSRQILLKAQKGIAPADMATCKRVLKQVHDRLSRELN